MFNTILVALDRSTSNQNVFNEALSLAKATKAHLILLHVLSGEEENSPILSVYPTAGDHYLHLDPNISQTANELYHRQWKAFEQSGLDLLRSFSNQGSAVGVTTDFSQITGHPSSTICDFAKSCHADVIIMGRRGYSGLKEVLLGSVSNAVVHHAPCSVLLVPTPSKKEQESSLQSLELK